MAPSGPALKRLDAEEFARVLRRQRAAVVDDEIVGKSFDVRVGHRRKITKSKRVGERAMLFEPFLQIRALHVMKTASVASIVTGKDASFGIQFAPEGVATSLRKHLETF